MSEPPVAEVVCRDVLFAHWPLDPAQLRPAVPPELSLEMFEGSAWAGILVVDVAEARVDRFPLRPSLLSINLRTYVTLNGEPGVYFISLETDQRFSAWVARNGFGLPYHRADIELSETRGAISVSSRRDHRNGQQACFEATYRPDINSNPTSAESGSIEEFLIERTNYFFPARPEVRQTAQLLNTIDSEEPDSSCVRSSKQPMFVGAAPHEPWPIQPVEASITNEHTV